MQVSGIDSCIGNYTYAVYQTLWTTCATLAAPLCVPLADAASLRISYNASCVPAPAAVQSGFMAMVRRCG